MDEPNKNIIPEPSAENQNPQENIDVVAIPEVEAEDTAPVIAASAENDIAVKKRFFSVKKLLILIVVIALAFVGWWFLIRSEGSSKTSITNTEDSNRIVRLGVAVGVVDGTAEYSKDGNTWSKLDREIELIESDHVRTGDNSRVVLMIDDGSVVRLSENSQAQLISLAADDVRVDNKSGELYSRVVASDSRRYAVYVNGELYEAQGTAFRTVSNDSKKGIEVYHSKVLLVNKNTTVDEGNAFFAVNSVKEKENVITAIDLEALKSDEFIKWNSEEDKKLTEFSDKLGVLKEFDKPAPAEPKPVTPTAANGITLSGSVSEYSAKFSWKVKGIDVSKGYKLVKSKSSKTPTYPNDSAAFIEAGKTSYSLFLGDGKTYYFRLCAYTGDSCTSYSNTVTVTTPKKEVEKVVSGVVNLAVSGSGVNWTFVGTAPHGFKIVVSEDPNTPSYGNAKKTFFSSGSTQSLEELSSGKYNIRVCKYTASEEAGGCTDYSNQVQLTVP